MFSRRIVLPPLMLFAAAMIGFTPCYYADIDATLITPLMPMPLMPMPLIP